MFKKIIACFMAITMLLSVTAFANDTNENTYVDTLSKLGIVKGNGKGYDLNGQIKRCEAAAIIVRLLGEEDNMMMNYDPSQISYYSDIESDKWYAPYINYIANKGIINGYSDFTFRPNQYISEKSVIKMLLGVLEYKYIIDFTWSNIYEKAYEYGLLEDEVDKTKTEDNNQFTRGEAFELVRKTIETNFKDSDMTLVKKWIEDDRFSISDITEAGLDADETKTEVTNIENTNSTSVRITFNEPVKGITKDNVSIIRKDTDKDLKITKVTVKDNLVTIVTGAQSALKDYEVTFESISDNYDFVTKDLKTQFKGYMPDEIESNKFLISKIEAVSKDTIKVFFTQPIGVVPTVTNFYDIYEDDTLWFDGDTNASDMYIAKLPDSDRGVIIRLTKKNYDIKKMYKLKIKGTMTNETGVKMNDGEGDSMLFPPLVLDNFELKRELTYAFNRNVVTVEFNKSLDKATAERTASFQIVDSNNNSKVGVPRLDPNNSKRVLIGMISPLDPNQTYKLNILNPIYDLEKATSLVETKIEFGVAEEASDKLEISLVEPVSNSEIRVYFNKIIAEPRITDIFISSTNDSNFSGDTVFDKLYFDKNGNQTLVTLYLNPSSKKLKDGSSYTIKATDRVKDYTGLSNGDITFDFNGNGSDKQSPMLSSGWILGKRTVKLEFDKPISGNNNDYNNYKIKYRNSDDEVKILTPSQASIYDHKYVILTMNTDLDYSKTYKIEYTMIKDFREDSFVGGSSKEDILDFAY